MRKLIFFLPVFLSSKPNAQSYVTTNTVQTITANKTFTGNTYGFNGWSTPWYTEGMQTGWLIAHNRIDVTAPLEPCIFLSRPIDGNISNPINFSGGGLDLGIANTINSWGVSPAVGDVILKAEGPSALIIAASSGNVKFYNLPTYSGSSLATQAWVNTQGFASTSSPASGYIPKFNSNAIIANSNLYQNSNGNLLIGKTTQINSAYILDINGTVRANKLVVNTTGADFVFHSSYNLLSLQDLENYIKTYDHLPGIESSPAMQSEGIDIGENQTKLLQKIEELTLYIIQQNKKLGSLEEGIKRLNDKLTAPATPADTRRKNTGIKEIIIDKQLK
jgi:hypothetical protein